MIIPEYGGGKNKDTVTYMHAMKLYDFVITGHICHGTVHYYDKSIDLLSTKLSVVSEFSIFWLLLVLRAPYSICT